MEKLWLFCMVFVIKARSQEMTNWIGIDCGSRSSYYDKNGLHWQADEGFIRTGTNSNIFQNFTTPLGQLRTLRYFTTQNKNCYNLPAPTAGRYFIRAMFHYGNYDGLSTAPTFGLAFGSNRWATVETDIEEFRFYELMYTSQGENISVCLYRTKDGQYPFISTLEAWQIPNGTYANMANDSTWIQNYRYSYGAADTEIILGYPEDKYNRIWVPMIPEGAEAAKANFTSLGSTSINEPPVKAIVHAIQDIGIVLDFHVDSIFLDFVQNSVQLYFAEVVEERNATRSFELYINDESHGVIKPQYKNCTGYGFSIQYSGLLYVGLEPTEDSILPPIISALEVYSAIPPAQRTNQDDLDGLAALVNSFEQLQGWSGDPCLPIGSQWQWLLCLQVDFTYVHSINLSGYGLSGPLLPDFSKITYLYSIDLSNNNLNGPVPDFLGDMTDLYHLDLSNNNFSGLLPSSITESHRISYNVQGNPNLLLHKKTKHAAPTWLIIVGLLVVLSIVVTLRSRHLKRKKAASSIARAGDVHKSTQDSFS